MLRQALRMTWRDWRSGELRLLMVAVALAVTALCAVAFFADRLNASLLRDAHQLLGGDVVIVSDQPLPEEFAQQAQALGLETTVFANFSSMARSPDREIHGEADTGFEPGKMRLANIKAVGESYPLRGTLKVRSALESPVEETDYGPRSGEVWIAPELLSALGLQLGEDILLGEAHLPVTRLIVMEPDGGAAGISMAPRVMLNLADLPATDLVQPASRVSYRLAVVGDTDAVKQFDTWATQRIEGDATASLPMRGIRMERLESGNPMLQQTLERAQKFLHLVALLATLLSAVAVVIASRDFARRHLDTCAMFRVFGVPQRHIAFFYFFEFCLAGLLAAAGGIVAGYGLHYVFVELLSGLLGQELPPASIWPVIYGLGVGVTLLVAFGLPPVLQLAKVPPLRVLRHDIGGLPPLAFSVLLMGVLGFGALLLLMSSDLLLGVLTVGGFGIALLLFAMLAYGLAKLFKPLADVHTLPLGGRLAIRGMTASPIRLVTQISALSVGLLALLLLFLLRTDLIDSWQELTPADAPNRFVINVMPDQADAFQNMLGNAGIENYDWYPMMLGRLMEVNEKPVDLENYTEDQSRRLVDREFSLSYMSHYPEHNKIIEGRWVDNEPDAVSVESGLMKSLGLKLGDRLTFSIGGMEHSGRITSVRELEWASMHVNFFVIFTQQEIPDVSQTYITAFKAPESLSFDDTLAREFPNITVINLSVILSQIQNILGQVIKAVEFIFMFTLLAGLIVLYAAIASTREQRTHDFAVMRALGAGNGLLKNVQRMELMGTGALAGVLASLVALVISGILVVSVFGFRWQPTLWTPFLGAGVGLLLAWLAGWLSLRSVLNQSVVETLRTVLD